jgi:hypothetical protein
MKDAGKEAGERFMNANRARPLAVLVSIVAAAAAVWSAAGPAHADASSAVQIDAGGAGDDTFVADSYFTGGATSGNAGQTGNANWPGAVAHPIPLAEWNTYRYLESTYRVPGLTPGASYEVRLYFLDWYWTKVGQRVFDVAVNGSVVLRDFDVIKAAVDVGGDGSRLGVERDFTVTADATGAATVSFVRGSADQPIVNAIVVRPATA